jgi:hypothetical protein
MTGQPTPVSTPPPLEARERLRKWSRRRRTGGFRRRPSRVERRPAIRKPGLRRPDPPSARECRYDRARGRRQARAHHAAHLVHHRQKRLCVEIARGRGSLSQRDGEAFSSDDHGPGGRPCRRRSAGRDRGLGCSAWSMITKCRRRRRHAMRVATHRSTVSVHAHQSDHCAAMSAISLPR